MRRGVVLCALAAAFLAAGCSSGPPGPTADDAEKIIRAARLSDRSSIVAVDGLMNTSAGATAAQKLLAQGGPGVKRWFALVVYVNGAPDPAPLRPLLGDRDPGIRVVAAAGLVGRGDASGFPVLVDSLTHTETLPASAPPTAVWEVATETLARMTGVGTLGPPFDANAFQRDVAHSQWQAWWAANKAKLRFNAPTGEWMLP